MQNLQSRLREARTAVSLTQKDMALELNVSQQAYQKIEAGKATDMKVSTLLKLCAILKVTPNWLLGIKD